MRIIVVWIAIIVHCCLYTKTTKTISAFSTTTTTTTIPTVVVQLQQRRVAAKVMMMTPPSYSLSNQASFVKERWNDNNVYVDVRRNDHPTTTGFLSAIASIVLLLATTIIMTMTTALPVFADEYGVEKEAPTIFTGETVEICTKRGPLGACLKTELRTAQNENDISKKYFRDPSIIVQEQKMAILQKSNTDNEEEDGNALIQKLRQQSIDNREKNELIVARKTFEADQSATFGPFDRQVLIMNTDGKTYTLLENPVAMRLKKAGFINDKRSFITQPTQEDLDAAINDKDAGFLGNLFGGSNN